VVDYSELRCAANTQQNSNSMQKEHKISFFVVYLVIFDSLF
jgi:hypothetical protein